MKYIGNRGPSPIILGIIQSLTNSSFAAGGCRIVYVTPSGDLGHPKLSFVILENGLV